MQSYTTLLQTYHELNPPFVPSLNTPPSALEFLRYVGKNRPFVVLGGAQDWPAVRRWNVNYLKHVMGDRQVRIAVTPLGNADAPVEMSRWEGNDGSRYVFVQPAEEVHAFAGFIERIMGRVDGPVEYAQSQDNNLGSEYWTLRPDVRADIDWASTALEKDPEAINLWIGTQRSTTALHKDNYENLYVQVIGQKHFVLLPPIEGPCVNDVIMPQGVYRRTADEQGHDRWDIEELKDASQIPVAVWDPDQPERRASKYSHLSQPLRVTLEPGDVLYLPSTWYHKVSQTCGPEGICVAVNYWYDMDFDGLTHSTTTFVREVMAEVERIHDSPAI